MCKHINDMLKIFKIVREKSLREIIFRIRRIIEVKSGLLKRKFPTKPKNINLPSLNQFKEKKQNFLFSSRNSQSFKKERLKEIKDTACKILNGEMIFFSKEWINLGKDYDWVTNPITGFKYDKNQHWSEIETLDSEAGDIKYIWEKARFSFLYHIIRYDFHYDLDHSEFVFSSILNWIDSNPLNCGPNFVCSQEISLRILNWLFALNFYKYSKYLTEQVWDKIINSIYWQVEHIYSNINFSRIAVRNNHAITETLTLYLFGLLFPELPNASSWKKNGKRWFEQEIAYQFEPDGTYIQNSMNYQRVVTQLLSMGLSIAHLNGESFSNFVYKTAYNSLNFLYQFIDKNSGWLPNYGSNDGALFFPLSTSDYRDYRPQLNALHVILTGITLFDTHLEESMWISHQVKDFFPLTQNYGIISFENSGYYLIRELDTFTFIRCGNFKKKGHPDQLHIDIWQNSENIVLDGGSYRYNASKEDVKYFSGTESHNTVMLDTYDQMLKGPRFMWFNPTKIKFVKIYETDTSYVFEASVKMFKHIHKSIYVNRVIKKAKNKLEWTIEDTVTNIPNEMTLRQLWHVMPKSTSKFDSTGQKIVTQKFFSSYYGVKERCKQIEFQTKTNHIITKISL